MRMDVRRPAAVLSTSMDPAELELLRQKLLWNGPPGNVVAARTDRGRNCIASGELHRAADVVHAGAPGNERRMPIDCFVVHAACVIVRVIAGLNHGATHPVPQNLDLIG